MGELFSFILIYILAMMSPGPDFAIVTQYGFAGSRRSAISATLGITLSRCIHAFYCTAGVAYFVHSSPKAFLTVKVVGSLYLSYLGIKMVRSSFKEAKNKFKETTEKNAFAVGFFTNLLNPKATVFLLSLFAIYANSMQTLTMKFCYAISIPIIALAWFLSISVLLTRPQFVPFLQSKQKIFTGVMGGFILALGLIGIGSVIKSSIY